MIAGPHVVAPAAELPDGTVAVAAAGVVCVAVAAAAVVEEAVAADVEAADA